MLLAFCWFKQAVALVSHVGFMRCSGKTLLVSHMGFHALLCDVTALARSWTSSDGWFRGERPADRCALEGAVAKAGSVSFERFQRVKRFKRESCTQARCFKLSGFGHRPQAAGPIRVSVWGGAPPVSRLSALVTLCDEKLNFYPCIKTLIRFTHL